MLLMLFQLLTLGLFLVLRTIEVVYGIVTLREPTTQDWNP